MTDLSFDAAHSLFAYCPNGDVFSEGTYGWCFASRRDDVAGAAHDDGYLWVCIDGVEYRADHVAWLMMTGAWPERDVIHLNGETLDNRWDNLALASE
jgi:hypothetical protein